jgi:hypothetical protein
VELVRANSPVVAEGLGHRQLDPIGDLRLRRR